VAGELCVLVLWVPLLLHPPTPNTRVIKATAMREYVLVEGITLSPREIKISGRMKQQDRFKSKDPGWLSNDSKIV
jgi:hypothetical protein